MTDLAIIADNFTGFLLFLAGEPLTHEMDMMLVVLTILVGVGVAIAIALLRFLGPAIRYALIILTVGVVGGGLMVLWHWLFVGATTVLTGVV